MKLKELQNKYLLELSGLYEKQEINVFFFMLIELYCGVSRIDLALTPNKECSASELDKLNDALLQLTKAKPIHHIIGEKEFFGLKFLVGPEVLIPRPETEELIQWIIDDHHKNKKAIRILDIGTGSGCIAISLAKHIKNAKVTAIDVSREALKLAQENARINNVDVNFIKVDVLNFTHETEGVDLDGFDIIVSNPPYVRELEKIEIHPNVLNFDPHLALFVEDDDPLLFYNTILKLGNLIMPANGTIYFEINQYLGVEMTSAFEHFNYNHIELRKDIFGNNRMMKGVKK